MSSNNPFAEQSFTTENRQLALALMTAGCRLQEQKLGGPAINLYTVGFLRHRKIGVGKTLEDAAREAIAAGIPGILIFVFKRDEHFQRCISAWDGMVEEFQRAEDEGREPVMPEMDSPSVMRVLCVHATNTKRAMEKLPWINSPKVGVGDVKQVAVPIPGKPAPKVVSTGTGKIWTLGQKPPS